MRVLINIDTGERMYEDQLDCKKSNLFEVLQSSGKWILEGDEVVINLVNAPEYLERKRKEYEAREERIEMFESLIEKYKDRLKEVLITQEFIDLFGGK